MKRRMNPVLMDGVKRPDLDPRWVPISTMADYLDVSKETLYRWLIDGQVPAAATKKFGRDTRWKPSAYVAAAVSP